MNTRIALLVAFGLCMLISTNSTTYAQQSLELTGTLRDFQMSHHDFECCASSYPLITGMVKTDLGEYGKPVLNAEDGSLTLGSDTDSDALVTVTFHATSIDVQSTKDLSNVVLQLSDGTEYKYDDLDQGQTGTFDVPDDYNGQIIIGAWIKSGSFLSGDGTGYGRYFNAADVDTEIPALWRIGSKISFNQWYRNAEGVNQSSKHTITLEDPDGDGIFRFERSKHNGQQFFPLDGLFFGNEGNTHNYHFTFEVHSKFTYTDPESRDSDMIFEFSGDDDVWVFVNNKLIIDIGGVHGERYASVNIDDIADDIGLEPGQTYDFDFFFAERHRTESNFTIETSIQFISPIYD